MRDIRRRNKKFNHANTAWSKGKRRDEETIRRIVKSNYAYDREKNIPKVGIIIHDFKRNFREELPGVDALEEALAFLNAKKRFESPIWYKLSLEAALKKVKGRKFELLDGTRYIVNTTKDVEQVILEVIRAAGIDDSVNQFMMSEIRKIA